MFLTGWMPYLLYTELNVTFIGTGLNNSNVLPSKISRNSSVVSLVVFIFNSLTAQNLTKISFY